MQQSAALNNITIFCASRSFGGHVYILNRPPWCAEQQKKKCESRRNTIRCDDWEELSEQSWVGLIFICFFICLLRVLEGLWHQNLAWRYGKLLGFGSRVFYKYFFSILANFRLTLYEFTTI